MAQLVPGVYLILLPVCAVFIPTGEAKEQCELKAVRPKVFVPLGEWVLLNCTFNCPGRAIWESRLTKKNSQLGPNWSSVEVLVDDWFKSELHCIQSKDNGELLEIKVVVKAYARPINVTLDLDQEQEEGEARHAICNVYDVAPVENLTIQLLRGNTVIHNTTFEGDSRRGKQMANAVYNFTASRKDDLQNFSCLATLALEEEVFTSSSSVVTVRTLGKPDVPVVTITPESNIQEGDSFNITCLSEGYPHPMYHWIIPTGADVTYTQNNSTVSVSKAGQNHNGRYTCKARNTIGWAESSQSVLVINGPSRSRVADLISPVCVSIITGFILTKTRIRSPEP